MDKVVPWAELEALVDPHYPKGENGRPPMGLGIMLRIHFLQQWFNLSDPAAEEALYDSAVLRRFAGVDLGRAPAPDETTILQFRHLLEKHDLGHAGHGEPLAGEPRHPHRDRDYRGRDHYSCAFVDQEREGGARPGDAPDAEGQPVVLRAEGARRGGREVGHRAFCVHHGGLGGRCAHAGRSAARR